MKYQPVNNLKLGISGQLGQQLQTLGGDAGTRPTLLDAHQAQLLQLGGHGADVLLAQSQARSGGPGLQEYVLSFEIGFT